MSDKAKMQWMLWTKSLPRRRTGSSRKTMQVSPRPTCRAALQAESTDGLAKTGGQMRLLKPPCDMKN